MASQAVGVFSTSGRIQTSRVEKRAQMFKLCGSLPARLDKNFHSCISSRCPFHVESSFPFDSPFLVIIPLNRIYAHTNAYAQDLLRTFQTPGAWCRATYQPLGS